MSTVLAPSRIATDKQQAFILSLLAEKNLTGTAYEGWTPDWSRSTVASAKQVIKFLLTLPKDVPADPQAGVYLNGADERELVRVYLGQRTGRMLAKRVITDEFGLSYEFAGLARNVLNSAWRRLSLDEVGRLGKAFDHCLMCGRRLDDPESVDRGVGPVCASKY